MLDSIIPVIKSDYINALTQSCSVSKQIVEEIIQLLDILKIPWLIAPQEAEAQCAYLNDCGKCNGVISEDVDSFLFGAKKVYRNIFDSNYSNKSTRIKRVIDHGFYVYGLNENQKIGNFNRHKMVAIAMLSGCDYTKGLNGVGIKTALKIIDAFATDHNQIMDCLEHFKIWFFDQKDSRFENLRKLLLKIKSFDIPPDFPSVAVYECLMNPVVEKKFKTDFFRWEKINIELLNYWLSNKMGLDKKFVESLTFPLRKSTGW